MREQDEHQLKAMVLSALPNMDKITGMEMATRAYELGNRACHDSIRTIKVKVSAAELPVFPLNLKELQKTAYLEAHKKAGGKLSIMCELLGAAKTTVYRKAKHYGLRFSGTPEARYRCPNCGIEVNCEAVISQ